MNFSRTRDLSEIIFQKPGVWLQNSGHGLISQKSMGLFARFLN
jgi:hypothetical protein